MRLRQWPGLSIQLLMAASAEEVGACVIQSVVIHAIEQSARAAGRFMNGLSTELLVFVQVGCRVFFEIGFGDFVQLERFALFGFPNVFFLGLQIATSTVIISLVALVGFRGC